MKGTIKILLSLAFVCYSVISKAQQGPFGYYKDALLFGQTNTALGSTARIQAIGGAQTALGGDLSSIASNPAGLGFFNRSVFTITPSMDFSTLDSEYRIPDQGFVGSSEESFRNNFNFSNIGTVINFTKGDYTNDKFKGGSLGISLSRVNSFHLDRNYEGVNDYNSIIDSFLANASGVPSGELGGFEQGAFEQYLINPQSDGSYDSFVLGFPIQSESIRERGSHYQMNVAWGGNYDDRLYFGGGIGGQILNYRIRRQYEEFDFVVFDNQGNGTPDDFLNSISIVDELDIRGAGINFNVGAIVRPVDFMTIGISYVSPTFLSLDEENFFDLGANWADGTEVVEGGDTIDISGLEPFRSDLLVSQYNLRTPSKLSVGTALFVGKTGFLTGDIELVDYANASINTSDFSESADNDLIENSYTSVVNVRVGGEYRIDNFRLRAGYAFYPSPYKDSDLQERTSLTFGFGYRTSDYFLDFAVVDSEQTVLYSPYEVGPNQPVVFSDVRNTSVAVTFGLTF